MYQIKSFLLTIVLVAISSFAGAQKQPKVEVKNDTSQKKVTITINGKPFTSLVYTDTMEKPFLYPIMAPNGETITRGFPWNPQPNDPVDHPHHIGLWFNYENVNGLDFWNNSFAIPSEKKKQYGWIRTEKITKAAGGKSGTVEYMANWTDQQKNTLLEEKTSLLFSVIGNQYVIDRTTALTAMQEVSFPDAKDGMLGLRVAHELELPVKQTKEYKDDKGIVTKVTANKDATVTGNYLSSEGKQGDAVWGTRGNWCMMYGKKGADTISIVMIDHPQNPGYPTYWHARNYGLFSANPLGQKVFSEGKQAMNFKLAKGQSAVFRYRILIASGKEKLPLQTIEALEKTFRGNN